MNKISLIISSVFAFVFCSTLNAQVVVSAGYLSVENVKTQSAVGGTDNLIANDGLYAGLSLERPIGSNSKTFYEVGAIYTFFSGALGGMKTEYHYANIPFHVKYKLQIPKTEAFPVKVFGYFGPMLSLGIAATEKHPDNPYLSQENWSMYDDVLNRVDLKIGAGFGFELTNHIIFKFGYDYGVLDMAKDQDHTTHMSYLHIGAGYKF